MGKAKVQPFHFFRLHKSFSEFKPVIDIILDKPNVKRIAVYEHEPDSGCNRLHVHAYVELHCSSDTIKQAITKVVGHIERHDWSFKESETAKVYDNNVDAMMTYMSKGTIDPSYLKDISMHDANAAKSAWKPPVEKKQRITMDDVINAKEKVVGYKYTRKDIVKMCADDLIHKKADQLGWLHVLTHHDKCELLNMYSNKEIMLYVLKVLWTVDIIPGAYKYVDYVVAIRMFYSDENIETTIFANMVGKLDSGIFKI